MSPAIPPNRNDAEWFPVEILTEIPASSPVAYTFIEVVIEEGAYLGTRQHLEAGRQNTDENPAWPIADVTFEVGDLALCRRGPRVIGWELVPIGASATCCGPVADYYTHAASYAGDFAFSDPGTSMPFVPTNIGIVIPADKEVYVSGQIASEFHVVPLGTDQALPYVDDIHLKARLVLLDNDFTVLSSLSEWLDVKVVEVICLYTTGGGTPFSPTNTTARGDASQQFFVHLDADASTRLVGFQLNVIQGVGAGIVSSSNGTVYGPGDGRTWLKYQSDCGGSILPPTTETITTPGAGSFTQPDGHTNRIVEGTGGGGGGAGGTSGVNSGGGGGGAGYFKITQTGVAPGSTSYVNGAAGTAGAAAGNGGNGGNTTWNTTDGIANGGGGGQSDGTRGTGVGGTGDVTHAGGNGGNGDVGASGGGGGGGSAGDAGDGTNGNDGVGAAGGTGGAGGTAGGGTGGQGNNQAGSNGTAGTAPGAGGGAGDGNTSHVGFAGAAGQLIIRTW